MRSGRRMTNKTEEQLRLYGKFLPAVRQIATDRSYKILNGTIENGNKHNRLMVCDIGFWETT